MSCYFVGENSIYQLACYLQSLKEIGFDYFGYSINETLGYELKNSTKEIYEQLAELNMRAVNDRYEKNQIYQPYDVIRKKDIEYIYHSREWNSEQKVEVIKPWHYQLLKKLQCFTYQCSEDINRDNKLLKGLEKLETQIAMYIVNNQPEYEKALWG